MDSASLAGLTEGKNIMFNFMPTANINRETGIHYGAISGHSLDPDVLNSIQDKVFNLEYDSALREHLRHALWNVPLLVIGDHLTSQQLVDLCEEKGIDPDIDCFADLFYCSEPSGTIEHDGLIITFDWLGGTPLIIVNESSFVTFARPCSPCVPNAGDLDNLDPDGVECYTVPENWKADFYD